MRVKIEIKHWITGAVLFELEKEGNTIKKTVEQAVKEKAYLGGADLRGADLGGADLGGADLGGAYLGGAYLRGADLGGAYLGGAYLGGAYLGGAKEIPFIPMSCPSDGAFIGWKKVVAEGICYLVKLEIPEDARRSSSAGTKCRCDKAKVLEIVNIETNKSVTEVLNQGYSIPETLYKVGEIVLPDSFDEDRWQECTHGIHFFINKQEAINYE